MWSIAACLAPGQARVKTRLTPSNLPLYRRAAALSFLRRPEATPKEERR